MSATSSNLLSLPNEILLLILKYVFTGAKIKVIDPKERILIRFESRDTSLQRIKGTTRFWLVPKSLKPDVIVVPLQSPLSILQTNKRLATMGRPIFWETVVFDLTHWSEHDLTSEDTTTYYGIPLDKFQQIELTVYGLPAHALGLYKSLKCLRVVMKGRVLVVGPSSDSESFSEWSNVASEPYDLE